MDPQDFQISQTHQPIVPRLTLSEYCELLDVQYSPDKLASTRKDGKPILSGEPSLQQLAYIVCFFQLDAHEYLKLLCQASLDHDPTVDLKEVDGFARNNFNLLEAEGLIHIDEDEQARIVWGVGPNKRWL